MVPAEDQKLLLPSPVNRGCGSSEDAYVREVYKHPIDAPAPGQYEVPLCYAIAKRGFL